MDPVNLINDLLQLRIATTELSGQRIKTFKKNLVDFLIETESFFSTLDFKQSNVSGLEFFTMVKHVLKQIENQIHDLRERNKSQKKEFDFMLSILDAVKESTEEYIELYKEQEVSGTLEEEEQ